MGVEQSIFTYGGYLGDYATYKVDGILNSKESIAGLQAYRDLFRFTPPGWNKAFFAESNQAITEDLAAMAMNFFAFFPAFANPQTNPHAADTGYFANPPGPRGDQFAALGGQGVSMISYCKKHDMAMQFLEWFVKDATQKKWAELGGYTCSKAVLDSPEFLNATPYNQAFYDSMKIVRDFWATPEYADLLLELNNSVYPYVVNDKGTAKEALDGVVKDWTATFKESPLQISKNLEYARNSIEGRWPVSPHGACKGRRNVVATAMITESNSGGPRGWSDLRIRNVFIIPTVLFLILFNIFPLIYSLGFSFTTSASNENSPLEFVGLKNYRDLLADPHVWRNFVITAKYVIVSVSGQMLVGFGMALLLNRTFALKGFVTTLLLLPMMLSPAVVGLFWQLIYSPNWGPFNYVLGSAISTCCPLPPHSTPWR